VQVKRRLGARLAIGAAALLGIVGVLAFVRSAPACEVQLLQVLDHPVARHDLVDFRHGPRVRASSALLANHHHPSFLVDGVAFPSAVEKWVSGPGDSKPWPASPGTRAIRAHVPGEDDRGLELALPLVGLTQESAVGAYTSRLVAKR
jgi:hypothetical protein